jgi:lipid A ethanolaminephosphotransferase
MSNAVLQPTRISVGTAARALWIRGFEVRSEWRFALGVSFAWLLLYNTAFWHQAAVAMWHPNLRAIAFMGSLGVVVLLLQAILLLLFPTRTLLKAAASLMFPIAAASAWFCDSYGVVMNQDMMRNLLQTDFGEVSALLNPNLLLHIAVMGFLPAVLVSRVRLPVTPVAQALKQRLLFIVGGLATCLLCIFLLSSSYAVFLREHKPVRFMIMPAAPVTSLAGLAAKGKGRGNAPLIDMTGNVQRVTNVKPRPIVLFLVVGETARAANFQLGGYPSPTNRELMAVDNLVYYPATTSCGTSTAVSVPCMFSHLPRKQFDVAAAGQYTNLLDVLQKGGYDVEWRENNAGCKGVCARVNTINYHSDQFAANCPDNECPDEIMLGDLAARLANIDRDTVIVFHQMGSHGPAYSQRYPAQFEIFKPACHSNQLQRCTAQEVRNAYDNTIAYTSHVLRQQIAVLNDATNVDGALIYASDHGESLGEQGVYLHGLPYAFAPREQTHIPLIFWASANYAERAELRMGCVSQHASDESSHDNLYHTVMGIAELRNDLYQGQLDLLSPCRAGNQGRHE